MLDRINLNQNINYIPKQVFKASAEIPVTNPAVSNTSLNGVDALAVYNAAFINNKEDFFDIPTVEPIDINQIKGEKIYDSKGKLVKVVDEDSKYKRIYIPLENDEYTYDIFDVHNNNLIFHQNSKNHEVHTMSIFVQKFDNKNNTEIASYYEDGKIISKYKQNDTRVLNYDYETQQYEYMGYDAKTKTTTNIQYDKNKKIISKNVCKYDGRQENIENYNYENGELYSKEEKTTHGCSDTALKYPLHDPDLTPVEIPDYELDINKIRGKKTYYSNGELESIQTPEGLVYKLSDDAITIVDKNKTTTIDLKHLHLKNWMQSVENLGNGAEKTTFYFTDENDDKKVNTIYKKDDFYKSVCKTNGKLSMYYEIQNNKRILKIDYDNNGNVLKKTEGEEG